MRVEIKIQIKGSRATLRFHDAASGKPIALVEWEDRRDFSDKFFAKVDMLLRRQGLGRRDIEKVSFDCDSPYFECGKAKREIKMEQLDSTGKCGFTAWQAGEIISKVTNFAIADKA